MSDWDQFCALEYELLMASSLDEECENEEHDNEECQIEID
jgi:hypothetical protein